jgi:hypothetical protein
MPRRDEPDEQYLEFVRDQNCVRCGGWPSQAAHFPDTKARSVHPNAVIPLCFKCHNGDQHTRGRWTFGEEQVHGRPVWYWIMRWLHEAPKKFEEWRRKHGDGS